MWGTGNGYSVTVSQEEFDRLQARLVELEDANARMRESHARSTHFLNVVERINRLVIAATDFRVMLDQLLSEFLEIFACDRAWLLYPCNLDAETWSVPMERTRPEWPGALAEGVEQPMDDHVHSVFKLALETPGAVRFDPEINPLPPDEAVNTKFNIHSQLTLAIRPKVGDPWLLGIHHCAKPQVYGPEDCRLFEALGGRIADGMSGHLLHQKTAESEKKYRSIITTTDEGYWLIDPHTKQTLEVNDSLCRMLECERGELIGKTPFDFVDEDNREIFKEQTAKIVDTDHRSYNITLRTKNGREVFTRFNATTLRDEAGRPLYAVAFVTDLTQLKIYESDIISLKNRVRLTQISKLASLGEMATGIAHEINQPLNIIRMSADAVTLMMEQGETSPDFLKTRMETIASQTQRAADIIERMRIFGRRPSEQTVEICPREAALAATGFFREQLRLQGIDLEVDLPDACRPVKGDLVQLEQVILNLLTNARDAIEDVVGEANAGTHRITLRIEDRPTEDTIVLSVVDTGCGIREDVLPNLFDPFFTTKEVGKGTGVGLSISYGIVTAMGGSIAAENVDGGARFTVALPAARR